MYKLVFQFSKNPLPFRSLALLEAMSRYWASFSISCLQRTIIEATRGSAEISYSFQRHHPVTDQLFLRKMDRECPGRARRLKTVRLNRVRMNSATLNPNPTECTYDAQGYASFLTTLNQRFMSTPSFRRLLFRNRSLLLGLKNEVSRALDSDC
ncbi:hypothetical protein BDZ45DRAFT_321729 [Acephala macrosclerotiorum]|nr:hypothetical protein BDZ45DRAFT_321729 [Acephala macrosclerotiorum]